ncbi:CocE/NonD family hydrolase [Candidatus Latescibacterota bacterium]
MRRITVLVLLCVVMFAQVLTAEELSQPIYEVIEELDVKVEMRDGVRLSTNIYRPDTEGKFPAVLARTPYNGIWSKFEFLAQCGYVVLIQDTRGTYESEGVFNPFHDESDDGYDTIAWVANQPWCNGSVGMTNASYVGHTQWMAALTNPPALKTIIPTVACIDLYDVAYFGGAFKLSLWTIWSPAQIAPYNQRNNPNWRAELDEYIKAVPLLDIDKQIGWRVSNLRDWFSHPEEDRYWDIYNVKDNLSTVRTSSLIIACWFDFFLKANLNSYIGMTKKSISPDIRKKQKLLICPAGHGIPRDPITKYGDIDFGKGSYTDYEALHIRWFDSELKGIDNGIWDEPPVKIFIMGDNVWRYENEWPLARTEYTKYYFESNGKANANSEGGRISTSIPRSTQNDSYTYDPRNPVPSSPDGSVFNPFANFPIDHRPLYSREDILLYTTDTLENSLEVTGPVEVILYASSSSVTTDFTAKLLDVYPDGRSMYVCDGIIRATHRNGPVNTTFIEPDKIYEYTIDLAATSNVFKKGHQIRVEISSSNFPRFDRNLNTTLNNALATEMVTATQTIYHDKDHPSCIILPVIPR